MAADFEWGEWSTREDELNVVTVRVPPQLRYLQGHFPGHPVVPGVAQLVTLAQRGAATCWPDLSSPTGVARLKFKAEVGPGDQIELQFRRQQNKVRFQFFKDNAPCSSGVLTY